MNFSLIPFKPIYDLFCCVCVVRTFIGITISIDTQVFQCVFSPLLYNVFNLKEHNIQKHEQGIKKLKDFLFPK